MIYIINLGEGEIIKSKHKIQKYGYPPVQEVVLKVSVGDIIGLDAITKDKYSYTFKVNY